LESINQRSIFKAVAQRFVIYMTNRQTSGPNAEKHLAARNAMCAPLDALLFNLAGLNLEYILSEAE
jgi:hypothetical protein